MNKLYYGPKDTISDDYRLSPVPKINIKRTINYVNDIIIGYIYTIDLNGYASTFRDLRSSDSENKQDNFSGMGTVLGNIEIIRSILTRNGSFLRLIDSNDNTLFEASGGKLVTLTFDESDNNWTKYCPFTASIEFNELSILGEDKNSDIDFDSITSNVIDITKYKIKEYKEHWSFELNEEEYNNFIGNSESGAALNINNSKINLTYDISATGKNYYNDDGTVKAAWIQAKDFVQERLYKQITSLIGGVLTITGEVCSANKILGNNDGSIIEDNPNQILYVGGDNGILNTIQNYYGIFNEGILCDTSESEGTFSLKYNSILKRKKSGDFDADNVIHNVSKTIDYTLNHNSEKVVTISIKGTVQGLVEGGLLNNNGNFQLPKSGRFLITSNGTTLFNNAELFLPNIIDTNNDDLTTSFKNALDIVDAYSFGSSTTQLCSAGGGIIPTSFSLTKNYLDATIEYSVEYSSTKIGDGNKDSYTIFTTFAVEEPKPILGEFVIPGATLYARTGKTITQNISTVSARKITITIEGRDSGIRSCCSPANLMSLAQTGFVLPASVEASLPNPEVYILSGRTADYNPLEGSYTVTLNYICKEGCDL